MAEQSVMQRFAQDYIKHVHILLDEGLTNCEEQVKLKRFARYVTNPTNFTESRAVRHSICLMRRAVASC